ncbi:hypothetical protein [Siminovitchia terrae]|uniref:hypothetical protein n=1 Tax=Siminovitchia terrae TaxID=1914933 RepID=UPI0028A83464|nr:hypothetical protein [Siminovitchia terrae]
MHSQLKDIDLGLRRFLYNELHEKRTGTFYELHENGAIEGFEEDAITFAMDIFLRNNLINLLADQFHIPGIGKKDFVIVGWQFERLKSEIVN